MKFSGEPRRIELTPETPEERAAVQDILDGKALIYRGDKTGQSGTALIINTVRVEGNKVT